MEMKIEIDHHIDRVGMCDDWQRKACTLKAHYFVANFQNWKDSLVFQKKKSASNLFYRTLVSQCNGNLFWFML